jgi:hypothetical protein
MTKPSRIILAAIAAALTIVAAAAVPALTARPAATARDVSSAPAAGTTIFACLTSRNTLSRVSTSTPPACPAGTVPVQWQGQAGQPVPSPSASPTSTPDASPSPADTGPSPGPSPDGAACVTHDPSGNCGPYDYPQITNSNGFDTYVANNCWADPSCQQTVTAHGPGSWSLSAHEPAGNTAVMTYPNVQQLMNNFSADGTWSGSGDTPISGLATMTSTYTETMPHNSGTTAQAAWDIWLSNNGSHPNEVMVWVDNVNRGSGGAARKATATVGGQDWTLYQFGGGELIWSLGAPGTFAQQSSGTVDLLALLHWLQNNGFAAPAATIGQIDFGWEICSTGGTNETFTVSRYDLKSTV